MRTPNTPSSSPLPPRLDTLLVQVRTIVGGTLGISPDRARGSAALVKDLGATSLDFVELVMAIEDAFGVEISDTAADKLVTVDDLAIFIENARKTSRQSCLGNLLSSLREHPAGGEG